VGGWGEGGGGGRWPASGGSEPESPPRSQGALAELLAISVVTALLSSTTYSDVPLIHSRVYIAVNKIGCRKEREILVRYIYSGNRVYAWYQSPDEYNR
jgi:hypothetical protein